MTVWIAVTCSGCHSTDVIRNGKTSNGKQRYLCRNNECPHSRIKRLARKTIYFSKSEEMHDIVIGLFINRYEFGLDIWPV